MRSSHLIFKALTGRAIISSKSSGTVGQSRGSPQREWYRSW